MHLSFISDVTRDKRQIWHLWCVNNAVLGSGGLVTLVSVLEEVFVKAERGLPTELEEVACCRIVSPLWLAPSNINGFILDEKSYRQG